MSYLEIITSVLATLVTIATFRKLWHEGSKVKTENEKSKLELKRMRRGG